MQMNMQQKVSDYAFISRKLKRDFLAGKITWNEFNIAMWIWINANPVNGEFHTSYRSLVEDTRGNIRYDAIRKIISSLLKKQYIYFVKHKGRTGSFPIWTIGFYLSCKQFVTWEGMENKHSVTSTEQASPKENTSLENKLGGDNHNRGDIKEPAQDKFMGKPPNAITTANNDIDENENKKSIIDSPVRVSTFEPTNSNEQRCKEIAMELEEKDLRFILSALHQYGLPHLEQRLGLLREALKKGKIKNKRKYFNSLVRM